MSAPIRFVMLGGFLGAGKTTTIARLARHFHERGLRVGVVTNDQAPDLVDTHQLAGQGLQVDEVAGACFCCQFDALTAAVARIVEQGRPDIILAEPVGSCTDLIATVVRPLEKYYGQQFAVAPYGVLFKPCHGKAILMGADQGAFTDEANYIFLKQLEEADFVVLNRIDELTPWQIGHLQALVEAQCPGRVIVPMSAKTGEGFDRLLEQIGRPAPKNRRALDVDYDRYAAGEAELGWLNCRAQLGATTSLELGGVALDVVCRLQEQLATAGVETAHLKAIALAGEQLAVANLVSRKSKPELSMASDAKAASIDLIVNARVAMPPEALEQLARGCMTATADRWAATIAFGPTRSFRPGRPVPTHRLVNIR